MPGNEPTSPLLAIRTLGTFEVIAPGGASVFAGNARARQPLLKLLLSSEGLSASNVHAAQALWPDSGEDVGLGNLRVAVSHLRGTLRNASADRALVSQGGRVSIDASLCDIDVTRLLATPLTPQASPAAAAEHIRAYAGTFLPGDLAVEWTAPRRAHVRRRFIADLETALTIAAAAPRSTFAIEIESAGERAFSEEPENEALAEQLARFYVAQGRRVEALATLDRHCASAHDPNALAHLRAGVLGDVPIGTSPIADSGETLTGRDVEREPALAPLIGRDVEREAALAPFASLERGRGGAVLVVGEPGAGTSSLASDIAARLTRRTAAVVIAFPDLRSVADIVSPVEAFFAANPDARDRVVPSAARALSAALPALAALGGDGVPSEPGDPRFALAFERALGQAATVAPLVIVAELVDTDAAVLEVLRRLVAASPKAPLAIVLVLRAPGTAMTRIEPLLRGGSLPVVELGPLAPFDAYELVEMLRPNGDVEPSAVVAQAGRYPGAIRAFIDGGNAVQPPPIQAPPAPGTVERLRAALDRAEKLTERGRLGTALPLLEAADEEAILAGAVDVAAWIALARAHVYALRGSVRATRALAFARTRAARAALGEHESAQLDLAAGFVSFDLGLREAARDAADRAHAVFVRSGKAAGAYAAAALSALAEPDRDARTSRARKLLACRPSASDSEVASTDGGVALAELRLFAMLIAGSDDTREITGVVRRAGMVLEKLSPGTTAAQAATELAVALAGRRHRAAPPALKRARELVARIDSAVLAARLADVTDGRSD